MYSIMCLCIVSHSTVWSGCLVTVRLVARRVGAAERERAAPAGGHRQLHGGTRPARRRCAFLLSFSAHSSQLHVLLQVYIVHIHLPVQVYNTSISWLLAHPSTHTQLQLIGVHCMCICVWHSYRRSARRGLELRPERERVRLRASGK